MTAARYLLIDSIQNITVITDMNNRCACILYFKHDDTRCPFRSFPALRCLRRRRTLLRAHNASAGCYIATPFRIRAHFQKKSWDVSWWGSRTICQSLSIAYTSLKTLIGWDCCWALGGQKWIDRFLENIKRNKRKTGIWYVAKPANSGQP